MKRIALTAAILALGLGVAQGTALAQSLNAPADSKDGKAPGSTGALGNANANGVATDPQGVAEQQKGNGATKSSAGTVGAAPGADTPSQKPAH